MHYLSIFTLFIATTFSTLSYAGLPFAVDGQPLPSLAPMLDNATPAVVNISTIGPTKRSYTLELDPFFRQFLRPERKQKRQSKNLGSGVIIDASKGYIVTNYHVIKDARIINITLSNGERHQAVVIGHDSATDIALIQIKTTQPLSALSLADSDQHRVGDFVVAIRNPFGLGQTVTSGIISALGRTNLGIEGYEDFIQTDASINPGNSGGALVNLRGQLVGVNTAILAPNGGNVGIGFAIPSNMVKTIVVQLARHGEIRRGKLGVQLQDLTPELAKAFNIKYSVGALISHVIDNSPAEKSGLKAGDLVVQVNKKIIKNANDLHNAIGLLTVDEKIQLTLVRKGRRKVVQTHVTAAETLSVEGDHIHPFLEGALLSSISETYGAKAAHGVMITRIEKNSAVSQTGLKKGDIIVSANRQQIISISDLSSAIKQLRILRLHIQRGKSSFILLIR